MAELRATPYANPLTGLSNDAIQGLLAFMQDKKRTQQLQGLGNLLESTGIPKTVERAAYADSPRGLLDALTNVNRANVPLLKPETAEAAMTLAPFAAPVNRALMQATKGLPVGASIEDVSKAASKSIVREGNPIQSAVVLIGDRIFTGRTHTEAFNRAIYEGVIRKEGNKFIYPKDAEINSDLFMTKDGQIIDRLQASKMFDIGASETAIEKGLMQNKPASSMSVDSYIEQANKIKKQKESKSAPRQEALDTAQRNAALPVEKGGLGLPKDNTPEMRAEAMGFNTPTYHGTNQDINIFNVEGKGKTSGAGAFLTSNPTAAETYVSSSGGGNILPLLLRKDDFLTANARGRNWADIFTNELGAKAGKKRYTPEDLNLDRNSATSTDELGMIANELGLKGAEIRNVKDLGPNSHVMRAKEYLSERYGITPDETWSNVSGKQFDEAQKYMKQFYESQKGDIYAIQDPSLIRSRFAAFDPMRKNEPDILAGVLPLGLLTDEEQRKKLYELMPSLLGQ
jgi:hypothetical protein